MQKPMAGCYKNQWPNVAKTGGRMLQKPVAECAIMCITLYERLNDMIVSVKPDRTELDMIYEVMLKMGVPLTYPVISIKINGAVPADAKRGYAIGDGCMLLVCLEDGITVENVEAMADFAPAKIILAESGLADDTAMSNAYYILRDKGIDLKLV